MRLLRLFVLSLFIILSLTGCSSQLQKDIVGTWEYTSDDEVPYTITYTFNDDGTYVSTSKTPLYESNKDAEKNLTVEFSGDYSLKNNYLTTSIKEINGKTQDELHEAFSSSEEETDESILYTTTTFPIEINDNILTFKTDNGDISVDLMRKD